ncbi:MAG: YggS family pyridoxal phosphate-dependent enzyme [Ilumatobacteraceae bacterium]
MLSDDEIARRWGGVQQLVRRSTSAATVVAVTKTFPVEAWASVIRAGGHDVAENYAQELISKSVEFSRRYPGLERPRVHFIGRLQSNKVRILAGHVDVWQSVDREVLVDEIARRDPGAHVLVQVDPLGEVDKGGCIPGRVPELIARARERGLVVDGLMVIGPTNGDPLLTRRAFERTVELADEFGLPVRSMGMSGDLDLALACGSTMVRVGSAIFGDRPPVR